MIDFKMHFSKKFGFSKSAENCPFSQGGCVSPHNSGNKSATAKIRTALES
jgi:hypothetical protein